jgi:hypothetical protein
MGTLKIGGDGSDAGGPRNVTDGGTRGAARLRFVRSPACRRNNPCAVAEASDRLKPGLQTNRTTRRGLAFVRSPAFRRNNRSALVSTSRLQLVRSPAFRRLVRRCIAGALVIACVAACRGPDWRVSQLYGGGTSVDVLAKPQAVEAFRIDPDPRAKDPSDVKAPRLGEYRVTAGPVVLDAATTAELSSILLDPDTYDWQRAKGCDFTPGVGLRFVKDASRVEIALCFECDELMIWRMGRRVGMEDFDDARPRLVAVVKKLFPDDAKIQALR